MFDFDAALAAAAKDAKSTALGALIMGPSGGGKSWLCGTFGMSTLYIYCGGENHGVKSALGASGGKNIHPIYLDYQKSEPIEFVDRKPDNKTKEDESDECLQNLLGILSTARFKKHGFKAVVIDGASELEYLIRNSSQWKKSCLTNKNTHNNFAEASSTINGFRPIVTALKDLQRNLDIHFAVTCMLDCKELSGTGEITEAAPKLQGYSVAEALVQQFGDVLVVGRMVKNNLVKHKLQFMTEITKTSKEENGTIKKCLNFSPRIAGVSVSDLQPYMDADLSAIVEMKKKLFK